MCASHNMYTYLSWNGDLSNYCQRSLESHIVLVISACRVSGLIWVSRDTVKQDRNEIKKEEWIGQDVRVCVCVFHRLSLEEI